MISQDSINLRCLAVDSRARKSGTSNDFTFELEESVEKPRGCVCWITDVSMPTTWFNVNETCDRIYLIERRDGVTVPQVLRVPAGQYTGSDLASAIQTLLTHRQQE